jgi:peptidoglycan hydrolase CwlO-like protein
MPTLAVKHRRPLLRAVFAGSIALIAGGLAAVPSRGDLASRYQSGKQQANSLQSKIHAENGRIQAFEGSINSLQSRLTAIQGTLVVQEQLLFKVRGQLTAARTQLGTLQVQYARDQRVLAAQLVRNYEAPPPTVVNVIVEANGFNDLLNRLTDVRAIEHANASAVKLVRTQRAAVEAQARRLATVESQRQRATAAVLAERDQVARLKLSIVDKELPFARARAADTVRLKSLQKTLTHQAHELDAQAAAAGTASTGGVAPSPGGCINTPFGAHGGDWGLFLAAGTNYTVGEEPVLAARLDGLGKALHLHLIGLSGYRTPQHSVEVGGFADDPHTRGLASDTPGIEGVSESVLNQWCLTRPFGGAAEADHIQEL